MKTNLRRLPQIRVGEYGVLQMAIFSLRNSTLMYYKLIVLALLFVANNLCAQSSDTTGINALYNKIVNLDETVRSDQNRQVSNFSASDTASLPVGIVKEIGQTKYIVCIDSAYYTPQGAYFNVYMALDFPNSNRKIAFAAKGIQFNPQGVIVSNGARLQLVSEQVVNIGPKTQMVFKNDGQNFIEWDCNGYKQAGLSIDFMFGSDLFENVSHPNTPVSASMAMIVSDLSDITFQLSQMDKFRVQGAKDFVFELQNITIDRSETTTPQGVSLPPQLLQSYNGDLNAWKGFYATNATITLPPKLSSDPNNPTEVYAQNLIIDDAGLSGSFGANNVFTAGSMNDKWGFSLDNIQVDLVSNHVTGGSLSGTIEVAPLDDQSFAYSATVSENTSSEKLDYTFAVSPGQNGINISAFQSEIHLYPSSQFIVESQNDKFVPSCILNGSWTLNNSKAQMQGFTFQSLTIGTQAPYLTSGIFSLVQDTSKLMRFPISVTSVGITQTATSNLAFTVGLGLNLGDQNTNFSVNTTIRVVSKQGLTNDRLAYDKFQVDNIAFDLNVNAFQLQGIIAVKNDDPVFGDLFYGNISLLLNDVMDSPIMVSAGFGKMPNYKYWFTDASVPVNIPIGNVSITSLYGGVQRRVQSTLSDQQQLARVAGSASPNVSGSIPFVPDETQGLLFRAGVGLTNEVESVFNGEVMLSVAFNPSGGFQSINMQGQAYMMVTRAQRQNNNVKKVFGQVAINYDHTNKILDANLNASIYAPNTMSGNVDITLHVDSNDWYFWLNRPTNRASVSVYNAFYVNAYFMIGTQLDPIPSPPSYITNAFSGSTYTPVDFSPTATGNGFAMGVELGVNFGGEFPKETNWRGFVDVQVGAGFDLLLFNASNYHCSGSSEAVGINGYYCQGQVYAYLNGSLGVRKYKDNGDLKNTYNLGSLQVAALLQGKFPKPTYVYGAVNIQANVLNIIDLNFTADIELGNDCNLVAN
jgi:hypothetical protein